MISKVILKDQHICILPIDWPEERGSICPIKALMNQQTTNKIRKAPIYHLYSNSSQSVDLSANKKELMNEHTTKKHVVRRFIGFFNCTHQWEHCN
jgi:hypothetical protein